MTDLKPPDFAPPAAYAPVPAHASVLSLVPFWLIPYDSLTYLLGLDASSTSQTLPLTALFAPIYLFIRGAGRLRRAFRPPPAQVLILSLLVTGIVTAMNIAYENAFQVDADLPLRNLTALRQALSMALGVCSFAMFSDAARLLTMKQLARAILAGAIPTAALIILQFASGDFRAQGFSSEPSHLADYLVWAVLPAAMLANLSPLTRNTIVAIAVVALTITFSTTGYLKAICVILAFFASRGVLIKGLAWLLVALAIGFFVLSLQPDNYVFLMLGAIWSLYDSGADVNITSVVDRFFGFVGPLQMLTTVHGWLGFGFGGDSVYFRSLFDAETAAIILETKGDLPSIASLQGKLLMYGGVLGYALYLRTWFSAWKRASDGHPARIMIPAFVLASLFSLGPLFLPYMWLWLAIAVSTTTDARVVAARIAPQ